MVELSDRGGIINAPIWDISHRAQSRRMKLRLATAGCKKKKKKRGSDARGDGTTETLNDEIYYARGTVNSGC